MNVCGRILVSIAIFFIGCGAYADEMLTQHLNPNQLKLVLEFPANPSTGYQWQIISYDHSILHLESHQYIRPSSHLIGASGEMRYVFKKVSQQLAAQSTELVFKYSRSWEPKSGTVKRVKVIFD